MSDASIGVKIGVDYQQAVTALTAVSKAADDMGDALTSTSSFAGITNVKLKEIAPTAALVNVRMKELSASTEQYAAITNKSVGYLNQRKAAESNVIAIEQIFKKTIDDTISSLAAQNIALSKSSSGGTADTAEGIKKIGESSRGILGPLNDAYGAIRKVAYALPGIGIGGIFALAFEGIAAAVESFTGSAAQAEAAQKKLNETLGAGSASVQGEVSAMQDLAAIALDTANSTDIRKKAFAELQSLYPGYLGNLSLEKSSYDDIKTALDKVTQALIRQAQIKGLEGAIADTYKDLNKTIADGGTTFQKVTANVAGFAAALGDTTANFKGVSGLFDNLGKAFDKAKEGSIQHSLDVDTTESQHQIDALNTKLKQLLEDSLKNNDALLKQKPGTLPVVDALQEEISALENLEKLQKESIKLPPLADAFAKSIDPNASLLLSDKIALLIRNNAQKGIKSAITDQEVALMKAQLEKLLNPNLQTKIDTNVEVNPIVANDVINFEGTLPKQLTDLLKKLPPIKTDIKVDPKLIMDAAIVEKRAKAVFQALSQSIVQVGTGVLEDIGNAFAGAKNPFAGILELLGGALEDFGKQLVAIGAAALLLKESLTTIFTNPYLAIAAGAAAIVIGAAVKGLSQKKVAFAEGGIVTGPTNALIGEAGPEVVFPLDKLNKFIRANGSSPNMNVSGQFVLRNQDLVLAVQRGTKNQSYVS